MAAITLALFFTGFALAVDQCNMLIKLDTHQFKWGYRLPNHATVIEKIDLIKCLQSCVRRNGCQSINFNKQQKRCEINLNMVGQFQSLEGASNFLYSEFSSWPSQIDPGCFERPCAHDQYCLPSKMPKKESGSNYDYICLNLDPSSYTPTTASVTTTVSAISDVTPSSASTALTTSVSEQATFGTPHGALTPITAATSGPDISSNLPISAPTTTSETSRGTDIRLVGGETANSGRLEVFDETHSDWYTIDLDRQWTWNVTQVVCRQMGFLYGGSYHEPEKPFPVGDGPAWQIFGLACDGTETTIFECNGEFHPVSTSTYDIGITCFLYDVNIRDEFNYASNIQLTPVEDNIHKYIISIEYNGTWTRVCGKVDLYAAVVFCNTQFPRDGMIRSGSTSSNPEPMWTRNIKCNLDVAHPFYCMNEGWLLKKCSSNSIISC